MATTDPQHRLDRDPRLAHIEWHDLKHLDRAEIVYELLVSLPWLAASWWLASRGWWWAALPFSFLFFLAGLRQVHNAFHFALGLPRYACDLVMATLSVLMLGSMHAVQVNHVHHHKHCLGDDDEEGRAARMPAWRALLLGPLHPLRMHRFAFRNARARQRRWIFLELIVNVAVLSASILLPAPAFIRYHFIAMSVGQCLTSFFAVWTVHHDCDRFHQLARTLRGRFRNALSFQMFFHVEHHLFPAVPTCHLSRLADRLDRVIPELQENQVF